MCNYEHLLSQDPIGAFDKIKENYIRYFENAYKITDKQLDKERIELLKKDDNLYKSPYIELLPEYNSYEGIADISELAPQFANAFGSEMESRQFFEEFIKKGLMNYVPYVHQVDMLKKVFCHEDGRFNNAVITTGTGSGKTESFLLPLLAQLFKEAKEWRRVNNSPNWFDRSRTVYAPCQRERDARGGHIPALRALVMYPMNALVEDQMARLRKALDSDEIREFMDSEEGLKGNRIYFGSYNGSTIGSKNYDLIDTYKHEALGKAKRSLKKKLNTIHSQFDNITNYYQNLCDAAENARANLENVRQTGDEDAITEAYKRYDEAEDERKRKEDVLYTSPRLGGNRVTAEMVTRWDMQKWAPDILITNVSMLSIMLMRKAEERIFEQTRDWLHAIDLPEEQRESAKRNRIFHIILDELHLYRDTAGSETACLIRMLLNAIGLPPVVDDGNGNKVPNPQLRVLASSASLGTEDATQKFMEEFFGVYNTNNSIKAFNIIPNNNEYQSNYEPTRGDKAVDYEEFSIFTKDFVTLEEADKLSLMNQLAKTHNELDAISFIHNYETTIFADFLSMIPRNPDGSKRGICIDDLIYQDEGKPYLFRTKNALRGFLIFRGYADHLKGNERPFKHRLPRIRFHQFFKYVEGMWGELKATVNEPQASPVQCLSYKPDEVGPNNGKVLELLRCECCGELFIGGNRKEDNEGRLYMTLNYPSLDKIPNFNPTPMVQNKSFEDYVLFWPSHIQVGEIQLPQDYDHFTMLNSNETAFTKTHSVAKWKHGYLDVVTGEVKENRNGGVNLIEGFVLEAEIPNNQKKKDQDLSIVHALPCCCPHCLQNYTNREYAKSPIRSFRTGIDRSNQLLSKELIYQLNGNSAKLIGFSDSRQDAAKQALGIETEHYRDMVRMLFIQSLGDVNRQTEDLIDFIREERPNYPNRRGIKEIARQIFHNRNIDGIVDAIYDDDEEELNKYISDTISLNTLIGNGDNLDGILLRKLVRLGINPAGPEYKYLYYKKEGDSDSYHWSTAFDYDADCAMRNDIQIDGDSDFKKESVRNGLSSAVFANSFGKYMGVSTLDAGIGYICCNNTDSVVNSREYRDLDNVISRTGINTLEFVDAFIRVLGDNYRYFDPDYGKPDNWTEYTEFSATVRKPIDEFIRKHKLSDDEGNNLRSYLKTFLSRFVAGDATVLKFNNLSFRLLSPSSRYYICPKCGRVHPNIGFGFCTNTNCMEELREDRMGSVNELRERHYISYDILEEPREPRRLHTEELTGQTDNIQERLLHFKDIVLLSGNEENYRMGYEAALPIDMVNVTTTMEVGVDIGSLEAIFQGNMPPTRYNYQQRVGRGGRRGQAFSTAVTFCRGRSHDVYYYKRATDEIVGGMPAAPELSLAPYREQDNEGYITYHMKQAIMKRVIVKELLHLAYSNLPYDYDLKDNCGEFGRVGDWSHTTKNILDNWLCNNPDIVDKKVRYYFSQFNKGDQDISLDIREITDWINTKLVNAIDNSLTREMDLNKGLAQCLSELGYLPMYGMPSDVRNFYHGVNTRREEVMSIDRSSEVSISEFAPGSEKTKDKGVYRVEALTLPMDYMEIDDHPTLKFYYKDDDPDEEKDALKDRCIIRYDADITQQNRDANIVSIDPVSDTSVSSLAESRSLGLNQRLIVIPRAYRSNKIWYNNGTPAENNDRSSTFTQCQLWAKDDITNGNSKSIGNVTLSVYGLGLNNNAEIWHVNSNNNRFFRGKYAPQLQPDGYGGNDLAPNFTFYEKDKKHALNRIKNNDANSFEIALGSRKPTEMICLELRDCPNVLNLNIWDPNCNVAAVRAAFFSAAFVLQRVLADELDVQPDEIEISEKRINDKPYPLIYLSDALPNGAGIVSHLAKEGKFQEIVNKIVNFETKFMNSLIDDDHRKACKTACQNCLLSYNNRGYHHVIDWRMGVGVLRLMLDPNYDFGFDETNRAQYKELEDFNDLIVAAAKKKIVSLEIGEWYKQVGNQPGNRRVEVFYHPLWNKEQVLSKTPAGNHKIYNIFNLLRSNIVEDEFHTIPQTADDDNSNSSSQQLAMPQVSDENKSKKEQKQIVPSDNGIKPDVEL